DSRRGEPVALRTSRAPGPRRPSGDGSGGADRSYTLSTNRGAAIPTHHGTEWALLVRRRAAIRPGASQIFQIPARATAGDRDQKKLGRSRVWRGTERAGASPPHLSAGPALVRRQGPDDSFGAAR